MSIRIATNVVALNLHNGERADAAPAKQTPRGARSHKVTVNAAATALSAVEAMLCEKMHVEPEDYLRNKDRARRGLNAMSGTMLGGDGKRSVAIGPIGSGGFLERQ